MVLIHVFALSCQRPEACPHTFLTNSSLSFNSASLQISKWWQNEARFLLNIIGLSLAHFLTQPLFLEASTVLISLSIVSQALKRKPIKLYSQHSMAFLALNSKLFHILPTNSSKEPKATYSHSTTISPTFGTNSLVSFSFAMIKYFDKCDLRENGFILAHNSRHSPPQKENQGSRGA